jgi:hypothetical protein
MDINATEVTVNVVEPLIEPEAALIVVVPWAMLLTIPLLFTVATVAFDELHTTEFVMF